MRLNEYTELRRGTTIPKEMALKFLSTKHKDSYDSKLYIFRGAYGYGEYAYIDPSKSKEPRISRNTYNYYTLMMDNFQSWRKYPKRSKSIICTTDYRYADGMGDVYYVFPENGAKIGVCPDEDIWNVIVKYGNFESAYTDMVDLIRNILWYIPEIHSDIRLYTDLVKAFKSIDANKERINDKSNLELFKDMWKEYYNSNLTFLEFMQEIIKPSNGNFSLRTAGDSIPNKREVWISEPCVLVKYDSMDKNVDIMSRVKK